MTNTQKDQKIREQEQVISRDFPSRNDYLPQSRQWVRSQVDSLRRLREAS